jgi:hypothetical protein
MSVELWAVWDANFYAQFSCEVSRCGVCVYKEPLKHKIITHSDNPIRTHHYHIATHLSPANDNYCLLLN